MNAHLFYFLAVFNRFQYVCVYRESYKFVINDQDRGFMIHIIFFSLKKFKLYDKYGRIYIFLELVFCKEVSTYNIRGFDRFCSLLFIYVKVVLSSILMNFYIFIINSISIWKVTK